MLGNLFELFLLCIVGTFVIAFLLPDQGKSRMKSAKKAVKEDFPNIVKLIILGGIVTAFIMIIRGY
jgi:uncharacterized membrane protein